MTRLYSKKDILEAAEDERFISCDDYHDLEIDLMRAQRVLAAQLPQTMQLLEFVFQGNKKISFCEEALLKNLKDKDKQIELASCHIQGMLPVFRKAKGEFPAAREWLKRNENIHETKPKDGQQ